MTALQLSARALDAMLGEWLTDGSAYRALADRIGLLIADGRIAGGSRLPAERELSERLKLSRSTIGAAYAELRASGYLHSVRGSGSIAKNPAVDQTEPREAPGVINFTQAALPAISGVDAAMQHAAQQIGPHLATLGYEPLGLPELRRAIADRYTERGLPTHPDEIMVTSGALQALTLVARTLLTRGDRVIVETPTYPHASDTLMAAGARLVAVPVTSGSVPGGGSARTTGTPAPTPAPDAGGWHEESLFQALERTAPALAYLMPDFQNPTGASMSPDLRRRLVAAAERSGTVLVSDETTAELNIDRPDSVDYLPLGAYGDVITLGSASKTFWGGLRIGWIRAARPMIRRLLGTRASSDIGTPVFEQLATTELVRRTAELLPVRHAELRAGRDALTEALASALPDWHVPHVDGGLCAWVNLGRPASSQLVLAARTRGVLITAGPRFGLDGAFERFLRLPINKSPAETSRAVDALQLAWRDISGLALTPDLPAYADMI
ncbi:MocR-like transcription factor YczR [Subtercola lobariae]|uniref:GntR family transcriptional regulator n=1 Tax=Subtercola lobariae TaxID=1588641 RepID=A0A917BDB3_9MICO|nr:PLP-dependent aminotransferase family protein [Subtercola lobariae]GGF35991.1 GntR family transcriptional regulator [Subtercola lobariae]